MKLRKTRIKKTTKTNGSVQYAAEYKWGFWWYEFSDLMGTSGNARDICVGFILQQKRKGAHLDHSEKQAKELIDFYISMVNYQNACEIENKVVSIEYEGYP